MLTQTVTEIREIVAERQKQIGLTFKEEDHIYTMNGRNDYP